MTTLEVGQVIDAKYRITQLLGRGGMGAVYAAEHLIIGRRVAIKVLHSVGGVSDSAVVRFEREAQAAGRIGNDHILEVYDFGAFEDGSRYMVCEYLDGETLGKRLTDVQRMRPEALVPIARQLLNGLGAAHAVGVVHRDLKPENIFLLRQKTGWTDFVKIIDFGISKFSQLTDAESHQMTATGMVVGTPTYLSPEQARGSRDADGRSDIYAVGVILYEALSGDLPFTAPNVNELLFKIVLEKPKPLLEAQPDLDPEFCAIVEKAMARKAEDRFQTTAEFNAELERWAQSRGVSMSGPVVTSTGTAQRVTTDRVSGPPPGRGTDGVAVMPTPPTDKVAALPIYGATMAASQYLPHASVAPKPSKAKYIVPAVFVLVAAAAFGVYKAMGSASSDQVAAGAASAGASTTPSSQVAVAPKADAVAASPPPAAPTLEPASPSLAPAPAPAPEPPVDVAETAAKPVKRPSQPAIQPAKPKPAAPAAETNRPKRNDWGY